MITYPVHHCCITVSTVLAHPRRGDGYMAILMNTVIEHGIVYIDEYSDMT